MAKLFSISTEILLRDRAKFQTDMGYVAIGLALNLPSLPTTKTWKERIERNRNAIATIDNELIFRGAMVGAAIFQR